MTKPPSKIKVLVLTSENSNFHNLLKSILNKFKEVLLKSEHDFPKVVQLIEFITKNQIDLVVLPNPYGNNKRRVCYEKLKENNISVAVFDRGGLPNSWFFDSGFNAESPSYDPKQWDTTLNKNDKEIVKTFIRHLHSGEESLENQGPKLGGEQLRLKLGFSKDTKIVFVPLQRPTDTVIKYFAGNVDSVEKFVDWIDETATILKRDGYNDYVFLLKKHPLEQDYFQTTCVNVGYVHQDTNMYDLLEMSDSVVLINSGVGLNALSYYKKVITVGESYYSHPGLARKADSPEHIAELLRENWQIDYQKVLRFYFYLINSFYSFGESEYKELANKENSGKTRLVTQINFKKVIFPQFSMDISLKEVLYLSPLIPYPLYRGNQTRIDAFITTLSEKYIVDLVVMNTSFPFENSKKIKDQLKSRYPLVRNIKVFLDPNLEDKAFIRSLKVSKDILPIVGNKKLKDINLSYLKSYKPLAKQLVKQFAIVANNKVRVIVDEEMKESYLTNEKTCPRKLKNVIEDYCRKYDYKVLFTNYAKTMNAIPKDFTGNVVLDTHDYQTQFLEEDQEVNNQNKEINIDKYRKSEALALSKADKIIAINPKEAILFDKLLKGCVIDNRANNIVTIPAFFPSRGESTIKFWEGSIDVLYVGSVSNFNVSGFNWFLEKVLPELLTISKYDVKVHVAGNISRSKHIDWDKYSKNLIKLGKVDNLETLYRNAKCCIAPILGGAGMKIKVVEAISYGKAVVATHKAVEGINWEIYEAIDVTDNPIKFASKVNDMIVNKHYRSTFENNALALFNSEHSLDSVKPLLFKIIEE